MKFLKLYISDLDGTLAGMDGKLSAGSIDIINNLTDNGLNFTIATARSSVTALPMLEGLKLRLPMILMNGIFVYHPLKKENIISNYLSQKDALHLIKEYEDHGFAPFVFVKERGRDRIFYKEILNECQQDFCDSRIKSGDKRLLLVQQFPDLTGMDIIHINTIAKRDELEPLYRELSLIPSLMCHFYEDVYWKGYYLLESMSYKATKGNGALFLKQYLKADRLVCFGDNLNDISLFSVCDEKYAVGNARQELKEIATEVIGSNDENGIAAFLLKSI